MEANFYVNAKKKTVVCKLTGCCGMLREKMEKRGCNLPPWDESLDIPDEFMGQAVCSSDDEFNEEFGKALAYRRAVIKMNAAIISTAKAEITASKRSFDRYINDLQSITNKTVASSQARKESVNKLLHPESN